MVREWSPEEMKAILKRKKNSRGQILAEYVAMLGMAIAIMVALLFLLAVFAEYNWRMTALLGWEP